MDRDYSKRPTNKQVESNERLKERLLGEYIDLLNKGEALDIGQIWMEYPEIAEELIEQLQEFEAVGAVERQDNDEPLGTLGDYTLRRQIGRGGMGVVYEAWENSMNRSVALKVLPAAIAADRKAYARFMREAQAAGQLNHPNLVPVHAAGFKESTPYYAMELIDGETLAQILARLRAAEGKKEEKKSLLQSISNVFVRGTSEGGALAEEATEKGEVVEKKTLFGSDDFDQRYYFNMAHAFAGVAEGLQHAHSKKVIHRDIKPSNLILDNEGRLRILDFGLARLEGQESLTVSGDFVGTPLYMSPEQARQRKIPIDHRTDVYSLGATMYEMLTWRPPFKGKDHQDTLSQIIARDPVDLRKVNPRIPRDLETIVLKCLRKDAGDRYGTAEALAQDLRRFVRGDPIEARPESRLEVVSRRLWRKRKGMAVAALLGLLLLTAGLLLWERRQSALAEMKRVYERRVLSAGRKVQYAKILLRERSQWYHWFGRRQFARLGLVNLTLEHARDRVRAAVQELETTAMLFQERPEAYYYLASGLLVLERDREARQTLDRILDRNPDFVPARILRRSLSPEREHLEQSSPPEENVQEREAQGVANLWEEAWRATEDGQWLEAARAYEKISQRERQRQEEQYRGAVVETIIEAGLARLRAKEYHGAIRNFAHAEALSAHGAMEPGLLLAQAYYLHDEQDMAEETLDRVFHAAKSSVEAALEIVTLYVLFGDAERALWWTERLEAGKFRYWLRAAVLIQRGRYQEALEDARTLVQIAPEEFRSHRLLGQAHSRLGHWQEAKNCYEVAYGLNPEDMWTILDLGYELGKARQHLQRGMEFLVEARDLYPGSPAVYDMLAQAHFYLLPRYEEGLCFANKLVVLEPESAWAHCLLGTFHGVLEHYDEAYTHFEKAIELDGDTGEWYLTKGFVLQKEGRHQDAVQFFEQGIKLSTGADARQLLFHAYAHKAASHLHLGETEKAESAYTMAEKAWGQTWTYRDRGWVPALIARYGYCQLGDEETAVEFLEKACGYAQNHRSAWYVKLAGETYEKLGRHGEALKKYVMSISLDPGREDTYRQLAQLLECPLGAFSEDDLNTVLAVLDTALNATYLPRSIAGVFRSLTEVFKEADDPGGLEELCKLVQRSVEKTGGRDPDLLIILAGHHAQRSEHRKAVLALEAALDLPWFEEAVRGSHTACDLQRELDAQRQLLTADLPSYASIDAASRNSTVQVWEDLLVRFRQSSAGEKFTARLAYFEGRVVDRSGRSEEAADSFRRAVVEDPASPEPALRLLGCLQRLGEYEKAESELRHALEKVQPLRARGVWDAWLQLCLGRLGWRPEEVVANLPARPTVKEAVFVEGLPSATSHAEAVSWLLERLTAGEPIRINCGGRTHQSPNGIRWTGDCFYRGGRRAALAPQPFTHPFPDRINGTDDDPIYQTERWFPKGGYAEAGYGIPVPRGSYRVALHFAEIYHEAEGKREFDVLVEGKRVLSAYQPMIREADIQITDVPVDDGCLNIQFAHGNVDNPQISGIEIHRID